MKEILKKIVLSFFLILIVANSFAQQFKDSVYKKEFLKLVDSVNKYQDNTRESLQYIKGLLDLSEKNKDTLRIILMLHNYARQSQFVNENYQSIKSFQREIELLNNNSLSEEEKAFLNRAGIAPIEVYAQQGNNYAAIGETKIALDYFYKSTDIAKEENLPFYKAVLPVLIGGMKYEAGEYKEALKYYKKGYSLLQSTQEIDELNRKFNSSLTIISMSNVYFKLNEIDSAKYILNLGFKQKLDTISGITNINFQTQKAKILVEEGKFNEALKQFEYIKKVSKEYDSKSGVSYYYNDLATYYSKIENYEEAAKIMEKGILAAKNKTKEFNLVDDYKKLAKIYKKAGDIEKSNEYFEKYVLNQKGLEKSKNNIIDSFHNKEVLDLELEKKAQKKTTLYLLLGCGFLISILAFYTFSISVKRKKETLNFKQLLAKIESAKEEVIDTKDTILEEKITTDIAKETFEEILIGLKKIEQQHYYLKQECSSYNMAKKINTNTTYLSKVINAHYQKNFNTYINDLRINYSVLKLKEDTRFRSYSIQSISEEIGYKSTDSFTKYFKRRTGLLPSVYIKKLNSLS
ncbi:MULTISPECIES: AraC family transcriptional regulator [Tenacibaculum]|uniref:AraC family transcriptional regulator n=1 Tax=Tenacibaculum TaxID=104267 RepID=UPI001F0AAC4B|nr:MULTISPECIES: AraC family transcriptional regulator [Tenacibaculum]MCH3883569.1 helix-turn-helix domain-containing protein [Tenacibaculum aquimarinum]MDO6598864.1 helix-turn-helix domain-containing protein [Tenacibaculum sp. 1_MG-2023]